MSQNRASRLLFLAVIVFALAIIGRNVYRRRIDAALLNAVKAEDVSAVRSLLAKGANPNAGITPDNPYPPALTAAWNYGFQPGNKLSGEEEDILCLLTEHGAKSAPNARETNRLYLACSYGSVKVARCLLEHGADPKSGDTPSLSPAKGIVRYYQGHGGSPANYGSTAEGQERRRVCRELVRLLQEHGVRQTLWQAVQMDDLPGIRAALDAGDAINAREPDTGATINGSPIEGPTALQLASESNNLEAIRLLLERGANVNAHSKNDPPPLVTAFLYKRLDLVKLLLARGADVNLPVEDDTDTPALALAIENMPEFVPELLQKGADVNAQNGAVLKAAIGRHDIPLIRELLKRGANVNPSLPPRKHNTVPFSPLMVAVFNAPECEAILLRAGAKIGPDKDSILPAAVLSEHVELLPHLLRLGADVNGTDKNGETALSLAVVHAPASVKFLLEQGAKPNIVTRSTPSRTPLSQAAASGATECVRLLLAYHADVNLRPAQGHTPLYYARKHNHASVATLLQQAGGKDEQP